jgi:hypothetical protein
MKVLLLIIVWCVLLVLSWPIAFLALIAAPILTVFSFGAVLDECLEMDLGIVLATLLKFGPGRLGVKVRLERDQAHA